MTKISKNQRPELAAQAPKRSRVKFDGPGCGYCGAPSRRLPSPKTKWSVCENGHKGYRRHLA